MPDFLPLPSVFPSSFAILILLLSSFMASPSSNEETNDAYSFLPASVLGEKRSSRRTVYIETDVSSFKAVVQKFTASGEEDPPQMQTAHEGGRPPPAAYPLPDPGKQPSPDMGSPRPRLKLHERRLGVGVPEIKVNNNGGGLDFGGKSGSSSSLSSSSSSSSPSPNSSSSSPSSGSSARTIRIFGVNFEKVTVSPMKNLACGNTEARPRPTRPALFYEEMRGIYEKGYYFHPNSATPEGAKPPPLLPLFPIHPTGFNFKPDKKNEGPPSSA